MLLRYIINRATNKKKVNMIKEIIEQHAESTIHWHEIRDALQASARPSNFRRARSELQEQINLGKLTRIDDVTVEEYIINK
jgi:predicted nucleic acid-binding protein